MPNTNVRVAGSGFTTFTYQGKVLAWATNVRDDGQKPISGPQDVTPLGARHPVEIVTGRVLAMGMLSLTLIETWNEPVWYQLGLTGADTITEVYSRLAENPNYVSCQMIIRPPGSNVVRGKIYHNCVVTGISDGEEISVGALQIPRGIKIAYTHTTPVTAASS